MKASPSRRFADELPLVSRATVYRTIKLLLETGVVCKLATMDGANVYSVSRGGHHHHHYVWRDMRRSGGVQGQLPSSG